MEQTKMVRNTRTTAGQLKVDDRFYFQTDKTKTVFQITSKAHLIKVYYNQVFPNGKRGCTYDLECNVLRPVVYLRNANEDRF